MENFSSGCVVVPVIDDLHLCHVRSVLRVCVFASSKGGVVTFRRLAIEHRLMLLKVQAAAEYRQLLFTRRYSGNIFIDYLREGKNV